MINKYNVPLKKDLDSIKRDAPSLRQRNRNTGGRSALAVRNQENSGRNFSKISDKKWTFEI